MKKTLGMVVIVLLLVAAGWAAEKGVSQGKDVTITGKLSCTFCNLASPVGCTKECCVGCLKSGDPVLLTDGKGNLYLLISGEKDKPLMTAERMNLILEKVKVKGTLIKRGGIRGIYVKSIEKGV
jgi:hypothetical protein